ncbi:histidine kinase [Allokutzneria sp. A3M-2-11 16]|uniref:sensor histidine kinase n=1 Tax=Allokutzneria sp. A3M-2-11 16 TaxID=2962043 RepID=UPI0020B75FDE|nr:histidine kinase [Allokutzneria sp. A3M-2-11 16]MCP3801646.1 histidine kinase [Allokutzneria sp. A3M-2-11 16]
MAEQRSVWPLRGRAADIAVTGGVALIVIGGTAGAQIVVRDDPGPGPLGWVLVVIGCAAMWFRRRHPVVVVLLTLVVSGVFYVSTTSSSPLLVTFVIALYTTAAEGYVTVSVIVAVVTMLAVSYGELRSPTRHVNNIALFMLVGWLIAVIAVGGVKRNRQAYLAATEQRAAEAERTREEEARRRATEERLRIARELHDALGHNLSMIHVQASAALHGGDPAQSTKALEAIKQASKEGLRELRTTLGVLRQVDEEAPTAPAPGLARLDELAEHAEGSGLRVSVEMDGERPVSPQVDLAAYRIVQEALTNVARHANARVATVRVHYGDDVVCVEIEDDGTGGPLTGGLVTPGNGIHGMDERARTLGGEFSARPVTGGFLVTATLPTGESA